MDLATIINYLSDGWNVVEMISGLTGISASAILVFALSIGSQALRKAVKWIVIVLVISALVFAYASGFFNTLFGL